MTIVAFGAIDPTIGTAWVPGSAREEDADANRSNQAESGKS